jgi:hypothetical protein
VFILDKAGQTPNFEYSEMFTLAVVPMGPTLLCVDVQAEKKNTQ